MLREKDLIDVYKPDLKLGVPRQASFLPKKKKEKFVSNSFSYSFSSSMRYLSLRLKRFLFLLLRSYIKRDL